MGTEEMEETSGWGKGRGVGLAEPWLSCLLGTVPKPEELLSSSKSHRNSSPVSHRLLSSESS